MFSLGDITQGACSGFRDQHPHTILYDILSWKDSGCLNKLNLNANTHNCPCELRRTVCLKDPNVTCKVAYRVLVKAICFGLPSKSKLPSNDHSLLLRHCWVPLFVLGLAQEKMVIEVTYAPNSRILRQILLGPGLTKEDGDQPTLDGVNRLTSCLQQLWDLDLSPQEYASLKGCLFFNPGVQGLSAWLFVEELRQEAQRALREVVCLLHPEDTSRYSHVLLLAASICQTVSQNLLTELFFKPLTGNTNLLHL